MKQRFYLERAYAEILAAASSAVGVSEDIYLNHLITQDFICGGAAASEPVPQSEPESSNEDDVSLSGEWTDLQF